MPLDVKICFIRNYEMQRNQNYFGMLAMCSETYLRTVFLIDLVAPSLVPYVGDQ